MIGYRRRDVEEALDASSRALADAQATVASREQELRSREQELALQRQQIDELDRVAMLLARRVVDHRKELEVLRAGLVPPGDLLRADAKRGSLADNGGSTSAGRLLSREA